MNVWFKPLTTQEEWNWVRVRAHPIRCEDSQGIVAYRGDTMVACVVLDSFTVDSCSAHIALDDPFVIKHGFFNEVARHAFVVCGRKRMFGLLPSNNEKALKLDLHIGFREVARIPDAIQTGIDYVVVRMDKEDCRFLPEEFREAA